MKQFVESYGRIILISVVAVACCSVLVFNTLLPKLKENGVIKDTNHLSSNEKLQAKGIPVLHGLGSSKNLIIKKGDEFDPRTIVTAEDKTDGDLTDQIKIYVVTKKDNKENRSAFTNQYLNTDKEKEYTLLFVVTNSAGLKSEGRIKILVTKYKENESERE